MALRLITKALLALTFALPAAAQDNYPRVGDIERGERIAKQCAACHGLDGVRADSGAPHIAGLTQEYLVRSLMAYRDGTRNNREMLEASGALDALQLADVTAYYSSLETEWHGAVVDAKTHVVLADDAAREAAMHVVKGCVSCHSLSGRRQGEDIVPNLDGMPPGYFQPALKSYFNGMRSSDTMELFKDKLTDEERYNLAAYYAVRKPALPPKEHQGNGNAARGKMISRSCAGCHGEDGNSLNPYIPNLTGQPAGYLIKAIRDYRDGRRSSALMTFPTANLNDGNIEDLAAYYTRQQPRSQVHEDLSSKGAFNPLADGEKIAQSCNTCHGEEGNSHQPGVPSLTGFSVKYILAATQAYQQGRRRHGGMQEIVSFYSDTDIEKAAYYYATREPRAFDKPLSGNPEVGKAISADCAACHGEIGVSDDPVTNPGLAGQDARYLARALRAYASGERLHDVMSDIARQLEPEQINDLAAFYAAQPAAKVKTYLPDDPAYLIEQRCSRCHGEQGRNPRPGVPRLAGQLESYVVHAMREYQSGVRKDSVMEAMAHVLSLLEIKAVAAYYAKQ